jgi:hypothetical protein
MPAPARSAPLPENAGAVELDGKTDEEAQQNERADHRKALGIGMEHWLLLWFVAVSAEQLAEQFVVGV